MMNVDDALKPEGNIGEEDKEKKALTMQSEEEEIILDEEFDEEEIILDEELDEEEIILDEENKEDDCSEASNAEDTDRRWYWLKLNVKKGLDEQIAFLEDVLKCEKSEVQTMHEFSDISKFYAFMTRKEAHKLFDSGMVCHMAPGCPPRIRQEQLKARRKIYTEQKLKKQKASMEGDCSQASSAASSEYEPYVSDDIHRRWYLVEIKRQKQRDEQIAFLVDELKLKCDKSKVRSLHEFRNLTAFHAYLTEEELQKLSELKMVRHVRIGRPPRLIQEQNKLKRKIKTRPNIKKQKQSTGSRVSEQRKNKEKWRYDEDLEQNTAREESEDDYCSSDSGDPCNNIVYYRPLDAAGKRWYNVSLVNDMHPDDQMVMLLDALDCSESEIDSIYKSDGLHHGFGAYLTEEQADKVAGLEEVEFVEPLRYLITFD